MFVRFLLFMLLFVSAAGGWVVIAALLVSEIFDPARMFSESRVHGAIFFFAAVPMLLIGYPIHRRYVYDWDEWSVLNLIGYVVVTLILLTLVFGGFWYVIGNGHAKASEAVVLYIPLSVFAIWLGGWLTVAR